MRSSICGFRIANLRCKIQVTARRPRQKQQRRWRSVCSCPNCRIRKEHASLMGTKDAQRLSLFPPFPSLPSRPSSILTQPGSTLEPKHRSTLDGCGLQSCGQSLLNHQHRSEKQANLLAVRLQLDRQSLQNPLTKLQTRRLLDGQQTSVTHDFAQATGNVAHPWRMALSRQGQR